MSWLRFFKSPRENWLTTWGNPEQATNGQSFVPIHAYGENAKVGDLYWDRNGERFFVSIKSVSDRTIVAYTNNGGKIVQKHIYVRIKDHSFTSETVDLILSALDNSMNEKKWKFRKQTQEFFTDEF